jgi:hypothetical protein
VNHEQDVPRPDDEQQVVGVPADESQVDAAGIAAARRGLRLVELVRELEKHVAAQGWDQNPRMFALARTAELVALEPGLAEALGAAADDPESMTPIEQELDLDGQPLDDVLATTMWPDEVAGAGLVLERLVLPPDAEGALPDDAAELEAAVAEHPDRQDVRMAVVVTRDGGRMCAIRVRGHDDDLQVLVGPDLVPRLADALAATLS